MVSVALGTRAETVSLLADLLEYPGPELEAAVRECQARVGPEAVLLLGEFVAEVGALPPGRVQELYSATFELDAAWYPHVGHHLLGESYRRSRFMAGLLERFAEHGFEPDSGELPDHLLVLLRFLAHSDGSELARELVGEAILPALGRASGRGPYLLVLEAIRLALEDLWPDVEPCTYENAIQGGLA